ncbi:MAG: twin-arginine translocation signal domain-containing protein, partial [Pseudolabrys sp.]
MTKTRQFRGAIISEGGKSVTRFNPLNRRSFLQGSAAGLAAAATFGRVPGARADAPIYFETWSAAVDTVKSHIAAFEKKTGLKVKYSNTPWAQYRPALITKFV